MVPEPVISGGAAGSYAIEAGRTSLYKVGLVSWHYNGANSVTRPMLLYRPSRVPGDPETEPRESALMTEIGEWRPFLSEMMDSI